MKRWFVLVVAMVLLTSFCACSVQESPQGNVATLFPVETAANSANAATQPPQPTPTPEKPKPTIDPDEQASITLKAQILSDADTRREAIRNSKTTIVAAKAALPGETYTGKAYYVSNQGNDTNNGLTPETAWATLKKVNKVHLAPGDVVFFQRGGSWYGQLIGKTGVTYSAYGEGAKPCLYGTSRTANEPDNWSLLEGTNNIWVYKDAVPDCGCIIFDNGETWGMKMLSTLNKEPDIKALLKGDLNFYSVVDKKYFGTGDNLTGQSGHTPAATALYLRCDKGNPGKMFGSVILSLCGNTIIPTDNTVFDNICVKYSGSNAIYSWGTRLTVQNCEFGWIGGCIQYFGSDGKAVRFGNAVENDGTYDLYTVKNCYVYQIYDAGLSNQCEGDMENITYSGNIVEYCNYGIEIFDWNNDGNSIYRNILVEDNYILDSGYGWCEQRPEYGWNAAIEGHDAPTPAENYIIRNNIFYEAQQSLITIGADDTSAPKLRNNIYMQTAGRQLLRWQGRDYSFTKAASEPSKAFLLQLDPDAVIAKLLQGTK